MQHDHCRIRWVDDHGRTTDDQNPPIGFAVITRDYTRGTAPDGSTHTVERYPICAHHKAQGDAIGIFDKPEATDFPGFGVTCRWTFEPLP